MFERIRKLFADTPVTAPGTTGKVPAGDVAWSESLLYAAKGFEKYNPDELMARKGFRVYRKMLQDEQVKAVVRFKRDAVASRQWFFKTDESLLPDLPPAAQTPSSTPPDAPDAAKQPPGTPPAAKAPPSSTPATPPGATGAKAMSRFAAANVAPFPPKAKAPLPAAGPGAEATPKQPTETPPGAKPDASSDPNALPDAKAAPVDPAVAEAQAQIDEMEMRERVLEEAFRRMRGSFTDGLHAILSSMHQGFSMTEKIYEPFEFEDMTWVGLKALKPRPFESFYFDVDEFSNIRKTVQKWEGQEQDIEIERFVHYVQNPDVDPHYGESELRAAYRSWWSKDAIIRMWNIFIERHASGFVWATPDAKDGPTLKRGDPEFTALQNALNSLSAASSIILPKGVTLNYETPATTDAFEKAVAAHDKAIAKALLVPNLLGISEQGNTGSYSQSQTQLEAFLWTLEADARRLEEAINEQIVKDLGDKNWGDGKYPRFTFKPISDTMRMAILKMWNELLKAGAVQGTDTDEAFVREMLDFPEAGEPIKKPTAPPLLPDGSMPPQQPPGSPTPNAPESAGAQPPGKQPQPQPAPAQQQLTDETIIGRKRTRATSKLALSRAIKRVDFSVIDTKSTKIATAGIERVRQAIRDGTQQMIDWLKVQDLRNNPDLAGDAALQGRVIARIRKGFETALKDAWALGWQHGADEINKAAQRHFIARSWRDDVADKYIEGQSYRLAGDTADNTRKMAQNVIYNGIKGDWSIDEIVTRIEEEIGATAEAWSATAVRTSVFDALNEARYATFTDPALNGFVEALEYSAVLDGRTTDFCNYMDGRTYKVDSPVWDTHTPPNHFNCRSILVAVTQRDSWEEDPAPKMDPEPGFGG